MAGFTDAGELGHAMESLLEAAANDQRDLVDADLGLIGRCLDRLNHQIFPGLAPVAPVAPPVATAAPAAAPPPPASVAAAQADAPVRAPTSPMPGRGRRPDAFVIRPKADVQPEPIDTGVAEFVRVRADQLDSLVNLAGEVGIIRTRLEQQVGSFRFSLEEFEQTVQRLREQLRKLEIEAETQILSREVRVQEQSGNTGFDPLEMDRFSQLQQLSRALAESMSDLQSIQGLLDEHTRLAESLLLQQSRAGAELQEGLMRARMVPFESMLPRLRRLVRQEAEALGKRVRLNVEGAQGELDRGVLERMAAPFEHMLRNALVHGLETPAERRKAAKGEEGEVRIKVAREATEVVIEVADDGRGIDPQRVRRTAIERGLLSAESDLSDRDLYGFILEPGFSTASELTQYAGRGVGLDVVASEIKQLGGSLTIDSSAGQGASFRIRLPYTLAVSQAVLVRVADHTFAIPMVGVQGIVRLSYANYKERLKEARPKVDYAGDDYEIYELDNVLGLPAGLLDDSAQVPLLMVRSGDLRVAMRVDSLLGGREIVVKPVGPQLARIPGVFGATILGDGAVVVILDVAALLRRAAALRDRGDVQTQVPLAPAVRQRPLVLVVDDSITMRKVSARVLEREGYEVQTAKDGLDALEHVHERLPDVILLDLEMPRMDGYEFAGYMRNDPRFRDVPIVVITSRVGEKHRARAFELGVNRYLGKPYQEADMLSAVTELLAERRAANER
jgi:chemosensory pili system protein ChpA (sensor histidine kinase/response regulator)